MTTPLTAAALLQHRLAPTQRPTQPPPAATVPAPNSPTADELLAAGTQVSQLQAQLDAALQRRRHAIAQADRDGMPISTIAQHAGIAVSRAHAIRDAARKAGAPS